jgi:DNA mismatch repair protein MutS2
MNSELLYSNPRKSCYTASAVDTKSLVTLELPNILERLAESAAFSASKELARSLAPSTDILEVESLQKETSESRFLLSINPGLSIGGAHDVRPKAEAASRNAVLEPVDLLDIKATMISARNLKRVLESTKEQVPLLAEKSEGLTIVPGLVDAISNTLDERGNIVDSASDALARIRRDLHVTHERLTSKLQKLVTNPDIVHMLQEPIITQRDGRFVIPLRAEFKGQIRSVIHDRSSSGATLFIEPLSVVDLNNQVRELELAERDEIRRILAELSSFVGKSLHEIVTTVEVLASIDLGFAKARYAEELDASEPILYPWSSDTNGTHPGSRLHLITARHPLLNPDQVVPIDLTLEEDVFALVITGPNTGGKTVALKTAGLLILMAQCGLHIPAASGSELSVFDGVFADIGDEQSIEQSLSTFSSHISNIIRILKLAGSRSLILLDELGAGTDPQEGAALARALLTEFLTIPSTTLVATHYPELKTFAHVTEGVRNASVEFDLESLMPTYHLAIGLPGRSNALAIAERLGLDKTIIERARNMISPDDLQADGLLDEIYRQRDTTRQMLAEAKEVHENVEELKSQLEHRLSEIDEERRMILAEAREEGKVELEDLRDEISILRKRLSIARQPLEALKETDKEVDDLEESFEEMIQPTVSMEDIDRRTFQLGERVRVKTINAVGVITSLSQNDVEVQIGRLRVRAGLDELTHLDIPPQHDQDTTMERERSGTHSKRVIEHLMQSPPLELDLRGLVVEDALVELERRLDAAFVAGLPMIRVIHGKGTGRLREAIRQALRGNSMVSSFEAGHSGEGGEGVTVVKLVSQQ